jgi:hypothetical protein
MATCLIVQGNELDCRDSNGGVSEIYLTEYVNVPQGNITASSGVITAATCSSGKRFFTYQLEKENATFEPKLVSSVENGTTSCEQTLTFTIKKMTASHRNNLLTLAYNRLHIIVKDSNGIYHWMGVANGADMVSADGSTGKAIGDMNGYTLTFTAKEPVFPYTISAALVASLQIGS